MATAESQPPQNMVFIGSKPPMNYVLAVVTIFNSGKPLAVLKARGNAISRAVDVAEMVRNKFVEKCSVQSVKIGTERVTSQTSNRTLNVSTIEIHLEKQV